MSEGHVHVETTLPEYVQRARLAANAVFTAHLDRHPGDTVEALHAALDTFYAVLRTDAPPEQPEQHAPPTADDAADYLLALTITDVIATTRYSGENRHRLLTEAPSVDHIARIAHRLNVHDPQVMQAITAARDRLRTHIAADGR